MAILNMHSIVMPLLAISLTFVIAGIATSWWPCGNLFTQCGKPLVMIAILVLYIGGAFFLAIVFISELCGACKSSVVPGPCFATIKTLATIIGSAAIVVGTIIHTWSYIPWFSYYFVVVGSVFSFQVVFISLMACRCTKA